MEEDDCVETDQEGVPVSIVTDLPPEFLAAWKKLPQYEGQFIGFMMYMLKTGLHADIQFLIKSDAGPINHSRPPASTSTEIILAHRSILKTKSLFFATLFSERWSEDNSSNEINLTTSNVEAECFRNFLQFIYVGQTAVTRMNVMQLYYLSDMYLIEDLKAKCETFLMRNLCDENVFQVFDTVLTYDYKKTSKLLQNVVQFIGGQKERSLNRKEFKNLDEKTLAFIFARVNFHCKPLSMLRFCLGWVIRNRGRDLLRNENELETYLRNTLRVREHNDIPKLCSWFDWDRSNTDKFDMSPAVDDTTGEYSIERFRSISHAKSWTYREGRADRISFKVSDTVHITGIGLYTKTENVTPSYIKRPRYMPLTSYSVNVLIYIHGKQHRILAQVSKEIDLELEENKPIFPGRTFKIPFDFQKPMYAYSGELYTISVTIEGPNSFCGEKGFSEKLFVIGDTPVIFEFVDACAKDSNAILANPTGVPIGQIPILYCKIPVNTETDDELQIL